MGTSRLILGNRDANDYLEYAWVTAPNAAGQSITSNTVSTLTIDTEVQDDAGHGSIAANQITLAAGTYYFEAETAFRATNIGGCVFSLYNTSDSTYVSRSSKRDGVSSTDSAATLNGQFTIASSKTFELRIVTPINATIEERGASSSYSLATAGASQRTTIKLWKLS